MFEGGLDTSRVLSSDPVRVPLILNKWVRFQKSGDYDVTVRSRRVTAIGGSRICHSAFRCWRLDSVGELRAAMPKKIGR